MNMKKQWCDRSHSGRSLIRSQMIAYVVWVALGGLVLLSSNVLAQETGKRAFLVGITDYFHKDLKGLSFPEKDAADLKAVLDALEYDVTILVGREATRERIIKDFDVFAAHLRKVEANEVVLVVFSGHGQEMPTFDAVANTTGEIPYFCARDAVPFDPRVDKVAGLTEEQIETRYGLVSLNRILRTLPQGNNFNNLLVVDACRSNPARGARAPGITGNTVRQMPEGMSVLFSASSNELSWDSQDKVVRNGVFTHYFLEGLRGQAANPRGEITWMRLVTHVTERVPFEGPNLAGAPERVQNPHFVNNSNVNIVLGKVGGKAVIIPSILRAPFSESEAVEGVRLWSEYKNVARTITSRAADVEMVLIPPGQFMMGNEDSVDELIELFPYARKDWIADAVDRHFVRITQAFFMGQHEITRGQFKQFVRDAGYKTEAETDGQGGWGYVRNPDGNYEWNQDPKFNYLNPGFAQTDEHPVVNVSWNDAIAFCNWLSRKEGLQECYRIAGDTVEVRDGNGYRLPTEAEWEYACRAGTDSRYQHGGDPEGLVKVGNIADASAKKEYNWGDGPLKGSDRYTATAPVGRFQPNRFDLFDMHGNVWEWCQDWYKSDYYKESPSTDPRGPKLGSSRVLRGGSWNNNAMNCRSANRNNNDPTNRNNNIGFRVVRVLE